jgi:hypothetical protein
MAKSSIVTFMLPPEQLRELKEWAEEDSRTLSNLIRLILRNALQERKAKTERVE